MQVLMKKRWSKISIKALSIFIIQAFLLSNISFAISGTDKSALPQKQETITNPEKIVIPREFGLVKSKFTGTSGKLVIHIQDAHCNYEAQTNIARILENLIKNSSLGLVSVEGADGFIDTSWFKAFPDDEVRREVADYFMKKGEITGPEFLSITTNYIFKLFGAETRSYYIQNLNAFTSTYPLKDEIEKYYNQIKSVLTRLKGYIYSEDLKLMDSKAADYESKKLPFNEYARFLQQMAERQKINIRSYDNFFKLINTLVYEKKIDFNIVDKERSALIDELSRSLAKDTLSELVTQSLSFKIGKVSAAEYYNYLKDISSKNGIELAKKYPNLANYIIYNSVYSKIENEKLFKDIKDIENAIKEKLFTNDDQRTLSKLSYHVDILLGLVNIKLLNGDFEYFETHKEEFSHEAFADFIKKKTIQYGLAYDVDMPNDTVANSIPKLEDFYSIAIKRDKALVDNTLDVMKKEKTGLAVLVTGGFHSEGIARLLEKQGVSYMVVCPNITKDVPSPYIKILTNQRTTFEDILVGKPAEAKHGMLAPVPIASLLTLSKDQLKKLSQETKVVIPGVRSLKDRTIEVSDEWFQRHVSLWVGKVFKYAGDQPLAQNKDTVKEAYRNAVTASILKNNPDIRKDECRTIVDKIMSNRSLLIAFDRAYARFEKPQMELFSESTVPGQGGRKSTSGIREEQRLISQTPGLAELLKNIELAEQLTRTNNSVKIAAVVSGSEVDKVNWGNRLIQTAPHIFNSDGSTLTLSLQEIIGDKTREGNFLGTLLAYLSIKEAAGKAGINYRDHVSLVGMLFGRGERMSPYTQIMGDRKPAIASTAAQMLIDGKKEPVSAIEEALKYFAPVAKYLEARGFRGILDKWGDETQVPSIDLSRLPADGESLADHDMMKVIQVMELDTIAEAQAKEKDWVIFDDAGNMIMQVSRNKDGADALRKELREKMAAYGIKGTRVGISLGPIATSYDVLDIAEEVFYDDVRKNGVYFDYDPYLLMALAMKGDRAKWNAALEADASLKKLAGKDGMVPDFFEKATKVEEVFKGKYGREINLKTFDLGEDTFWVDIGQHEAMKEKYMALNDQGPKGIVARKIENIPGVRDANGNIIINSTISPDVTVTNSVIVNSTISGKGVITGSVIKDSKLADVDITEAFAVLSTRAGMTALQKGSGLYMSIGREDLPLEEGMRHGTLLTSKGPVDMRVHTDTNLRNKAETYDVPIFGNTMSFDAAYNEMFGVSMEELARRRVEAESPVLQLIRAGDGRRSTAGIVRQEDLTPEAQDRIKTVLTKFAKKEVKKEELLALTAAKYRELIGVEVTEPQKEIEAIKGCAAKFNPLSFGTSGLRDTVVNMTDLECYLNAMGFIEYLIAAGDIERGDKIAIAGDRRSSTDRIMAAVAKAIEDSGCRVDNQGKIPSPALAYYAMQSGMASIMVTGSHIPDDRNGIKFTKKSGEVLKADETGILDNVAGARLAEYFNPQVEKFDDNGMFKTKAALPVAHRAAKNLYIKRYLDAFPDKPLQGKTIVLYQHSAVGRDIMRTILKGLGAKVIAIKPSKDFVPVDTEKVSEGTKRILEAAAKKYKPDMIMSADGDSDRPLFTDELGNFLPGDKLGFLAAQYLKPTFISTPISANSGVVQGFRDMGIKVRTTQIGSPFVIKAMNDELAVNPGAKVASFEVNGGFLTGSDWNINGRILKALPTRDAMLPILSAMFLAKEKGLTISELIDQHTPHVYTQANVIDDTTPGCEIYTADMGKELVKTLSPEQSNIEEVNFVDERVIAVYAEGAGVAPLSGEAAERMIGIKEELEKYFISRNGFSKIETINYIDGVRIYFDNSEIAHFRPSGNAPEFRFYAEATTQERADSIVEMRLDILPNIISTFNSSRSSTNGRAPDELEKLLLKLPSELAGKIVAERDELDETVKRIASRRLSDVNTMNKVAIVAIDMSLYNNGANEVITQLPKTISVGENGVIIARAANAEGLSSAITQAAEEAAGRGLEITNVVTQVSAQASPAIKDALAKNGVVLSIDLEGKRLEDYYLQIIRLFDLSLKIAYEFEPEAIRATLSKIMGKEIAIGDIKDMLAKKILEILPDMKPIDTSIAVDTYKAVRVALSSV